MSAPLSHDPLVVNTKDGAVWWRRAVTEDGRGLYAADGSCKCPEFLLVPLSELAVHGIVGTADVLPVPVGPQPQAKPLRTDELTPGVVVIAKDMTRFTVDSVTPCTLDWRFEGKQADGTRTSETGMEVVGHDAAGEAVYFTAAQSHLWFRDVTALPVPVGPKAVPLSGPVCSQSEARAAGLDVAPSVAELDAMAESVVALGDPLSAEVSLAQAVPLLTAAVTGLRSQVAALLEERHSTNESVSEAAEALRVQRDRIAALESGPALPWAHEMPDGDLHGFLDDMVSAAMGRWRSEPEVPDRTVLADIEKVCADWRTPGEGYRSDPESDEPAPIQADGFFDGVPVSPPSERPVDGLTATFMPVAALREASSREEPHDSPLHQAYRVGHDLPEMGGAL